MNAKNEARREAVANISAPTSIPPIIQKIGVLFVALAEMRKHFNLKGIIQNESFVSEPNI